MATCSDVAVLLVELDEAIAYYADKPIDLDVLNVWRDRVAALARPQPERLCTVGGCMLPLAHEGLHEWAQGRPQSGTPEVEALTDEAMAALERMGARPQPESGDLAALRERVIAAMPWYDETNPDYTELDAVLAGVHVGADTGLSPHPGENHEFRTTCLRCGEPGYLFVGLHAPGETWTVNPAPPPGCSICGETVEHRLPDHSYIPALAATPKEPSDG